MENKNNNSTAYVILIIIILIFFWAVGNQSQPSGYDSGSSYPYP